jgi:2,4-dichlorophenol 6-monooxygenase
VEIVAYVIGPGREVLDTYDDWARLREVGEAGCVLVSPDMHVAWRSADLAADPTVAVGEAMASLLAGAGAGTTNREALSTA